MKIPRRLGSFFAAVALLLFAASGLSRAQFKVGMTTRIFHPQAQRNWRGSEHHELRVTVWYPAAENAVEAPQVIGPAEAPLFLAGEAAPHAAFAPALEKWPLILLSHGTGGSAMQMAWLGTALARAGYMVAAVAPRWSSAPHAACRPGCPYSSSPAHGTPSSAAVDDTGPRAR
jgi:predicted dienelactone hydrolase